LFQLPQSDLSNNVRLHFYSDFVRKIVLVKRLRRKKKGKKRYRRRGNEGIVREKWRMTVRRGEGGQVTEKRGDW
jgi:hypothetical protein